MKLSDLSKLEVVRCLLIRHKKTRVDGWAILQFEMIDKCLGELLSPMFAPCGAPHVHGDQGQFTHGKNGTKVLEMTIAQSVCVLFRHNGFYLKAQYHSFQLLCKFLQSADFVPQSLLWGN